MNKADKYLKETITEILEEGQWDKEPRTRWADGTPAHSKFVTQKVYQYDISKSEFPISTLRNGSLKNSFKELKTIYIDQSNKQEDFLNSGISWWGNWMNEEGNLGTAYSWNLESGISERIVSIPERKLDSLLGEPIEPNTIQQLNVENSLGMFNEQYLFFDDFKRDKVNRVTYQRIQFIKSGVYRYVNKQLICKGYIPDIFDRNTYDIGYIGDLSKINHLSEKHISLLKDKWENMFRRCYSEKYEHKKLYEDVFVHYRWHSFSNFLNDIVYIPNFFLAKEADFKGWELDKDYYNSNAYSLETCCFLPKRLNILYSTAKPVRYGNMLFMSYEDCAKYIGTYSRKIKEIIQGTIENPFELTISTPKETNLRFENSRNQVNELLKNLKRDKFSRRHMLSFFNWSHQDKKTLVECAFQSLFSVREIDRINYLDSTLIQRSSDFILAGMINCSQYVMLNMIICNHLKYVTGEEWVTGKFIWVVQNCHIYDRHLDAAKEILKRESTGLQPKIELICEPKDFYSHTIEDFKFSGLEGIEKLSNNLEIAI